MLTFVIGGTLLTGLAIVGSTYQKLLEESKGESQVESSTPFGMKIFFIILGISICGLIVSLAIKIVAYLKFA